MKYHIFKLLIIWLQLQTLVDSQGNKQCLPLFSLKGTMEL